MPLSYMHAYSFSFSKIALSKNWYDLSNLSKNSSFEYSIFDVSGPIVFLNLMKYAEYVFVQSFHGTVFSIIYKKEFFVMLPSKRPERIISLLNKLGLENRIIYDVENLKEIIKDKIDYKNIEKKLEDERNKSLKYITKVIGGKIKWKLL